jgi:hypothetical protein
MAGPTTQNQYTPQAVQFDGGLDYINPKISIAPGTLSACLNFERTDRIGYTRIFGTERFDGGASPSLAYTNLAYLVLTSSLSEPTRTPIWLLDADNNPLPEMGAIVHSDAVVQLVAITNYDQWRLLKYNIANSITVKIGTANGNTRTVTTLLTFNQGYSTSISPTPADAAVYTAGRNTYFEELRDAVGWPGEAAKPVIGLHGYKDQIYAIKDCRVDYFTNGAHQVFSNDLIRPHSDVSDVNAFTVLDVHLLSGSWGGGTATGLILSTLPVGPTLGAYDIHRPNTAIIANALTLALPIAGVDINAWAAQLWKSHSYAQAQEESTTVGWHTVDVGFKTSFIDGKSNGPFRVARRGKFSTFDTDVITTSDFGTVGSITDSTPGSPAPGDSTALVNAATVPIALQEDTSGSNKFVQVNMNDTVAPNLYEPADIYISNFPAFSGFSGSGSLNVKGIQVDIDVRGFPQNDGIRQMTLNIQPVTADTTILPGTSPKTQTIPVNQNPPSQQTVHRLTFGDDAELWGLDAAGMKAAMDSGWGFKVQPYIQYLDSLRSGRIDVLTVKITVYYTDTITNYYFYDGVDDVTADITNYFKFSGDWSSNDAAGTLQVTNIQPYATAVRKYIKAGDQIRTDPGGAGLLIATVGSDNMTFNGLDPLNELEDNESRYEFIVANFYGSDDFEALYGVSGAGRAFSWDGFYFDRIYALQPDGKLTQQELDDKDKPRHLADHQFHLVLGYKPGAMALSVSGNPQSYDGVLGATEIDTGDPIVGFAKMQGTTLGIFCNKTIQGLVGTSIDNFSLTVLQAYEGAKEYTVCDVGRPIYTSYKGISFFDQSAAYGDFVGQRLSYAVTPFLIPRLQGLVAPFGAVAASNGPVCAIPIRSKNQYCLIFGDGYWLVMTLVGGDQQPQFTIRSYGYYNGGSFVGYMVPRAESSFIDSKGTEHVHIAPYSTFTPTIHYYVYELERSWTFDGEGIPAYFVTNDNFYGNLYDFDNARKARIHGVTLGYAPLRCRVKTDYNPNSDVIVSEREAIEVNLPYSPASTLADDFVSATSKNDPSARGRSFNYRFMSYNITSQPTTVPDPVYATVCPPFVIQAMLVQNTENKGDV